MREDRGRDRASRLFDVARIKCYMRVCRTNRKRMERVVFDSQRKMKKMSGSRLSDPVRLCNVM